MPSLPIEAAPDVKMIAAPKSPASALLTATKNTGENGPDAGGHSRRQAVHYLMALIILAVAMAALVRPMLFEDRPRAPATPPDKALYRQDGGQTLAAGGTLTPNALTSLNLGRRVDLAATPAAHLAALPSVGEGGANKTAATGCLTDAQRATLKGLAKESDVCGKR